jgi:hypothetical protein
MQQKTVHFVAQVRKNSCNTPFISASAICHKLPSTFISGPAAAG